ncbi:hypothetical protein [Natrarchaeobius halalkaliphilus]|uniref:hypothetical protein n=1 Tax=Natrarchaeobius halalkaliphilus TaxID=1679091 RepID=UPI001405168A|nr:hypothetical protein [Natrarchaeobius halalkaliphilus]
MEDGTPYTAYEIGYLEPEPDEPAFDVAVAVDGTPDEMPTDSSNEYDETDD